MVAFEWIDFVFQNFQFKPPISIGFTFQISLQYVSIALSLLKNPILAIFSSIIVANNDLSLYDGITSYKYVSI